MDTEHLRGRASGDGLPDLLDQPPPFEGIQQRRFVVVQGLCLSRFAPSRSRRLKPSQPLQRSCSSVGVPTRARNSSPVSQRTSQPAARPPPAADLPASDFAPERQPPPSGCSPANRLSRRVARQARGSAAMADTAPAPRQRGRSAPAHRPPPSCSSHRAPSQSSRASFGAHAPWVARVASEAPVVRAKCAFPDLVPGQDAAPNGCAKRCGVRRSPSRNRSRRGLLSPDARPLSPATRVNQSE